MRRIEESEDVLKGSELVEYDEALVRKLIERITVKDESFVIGFKVWD